MLGQPQLPRDLEGVRLADVADVQPILGLQRLVVELDGGVLGAGVGERVGLQVADVGRDDRAAADAVELVEDRPAQGRAVGRVGARPELVEQDQRARRRLAQDLADPPHVRREGRERLLQALLVADIGEHVVEDRELRALAGRDVQAGLGHDRQQADRLERDRLAAGVRAGHDQDLKSNPEIHVDRRHGPWARAEVRDAGGRRSAGSAIAGAAGVRARGPARRPAAARSGRVAGRRWRDRPETALRAADAGRREARAVPPG